MSKRAILKVPAPAMFEHLRQLQLEMLGPRWRFRGSHPSPAEFQRLLYEGTLCSFAIMPRPTPESSATAAPIVGLASCFNVFPHDGHAEFSLARLTNGMVEGRLLDYFWANGKHWVKVIVSIERERWETFAKNHPMTI